MAQCSPMTTNAAPAGLVHSTRYQRRALRLRSARWTWLAMVVQSVRLALRNTRNVVLLLIAVGFVGLGASIFYVLSLVEELAGTSEAQGLYSIIYTFVRVDLSGAAQIGAYRLQLWQAVFILLMKLELFYTLIVVGQLGPGLIADDLKSRALPIYFARPITPLTYLLGKWLTIGAFIAVAIWLPNILALLIGVFVAGAPGTWSQTLGLAGDLTLVGVGVMLVGGLLILALSSLTADKRFVIVGWLAVLLLPHVTQQMLYHQLPAEHTRGFLGSLSLNNDVLILTTRLFHLREAWAATGLPARAYEAGLAPAVPPLYPALVLLAVAVVAGAVCYRRVVRFSQSAANL